MPDPLADLEVRVGWNDARFRQSSARTVSQFNRDARSIENRASQLNSRLSKVRSFEISRQGRASFINFGQQLQDVAVQAEQGTNALRIFSQQGPQILSVFGPVGVTLGIVAATAGAVASSLINTSEASEEADDAISDMQSSLSSAESQFSALIKAAEAYQTAIRAAGDESITTANKVVAATRTEFEARKRLLNLDLLQARDDLTASRNRQATLVESLTELETGVARSDPAATRRGALGPGLDDPALRRERLLEARPNAETSSGLTVREQTAEAERLRREITRIGSEATLTEGRLNAMSDALSASFEDLAAEAGGSNRSSGGGSARSAIAREGAFGSLITQTQERLAALQNERQQIGLTARESEVLSASFEREKLVRELIAAAQKDGTAATAEEIALAQNLAAGLETLTIANFDLAEKVKERNEAEKQSIKDQEELARSISNTSNKFINAARNAGTFKDALKNIGFLLFELGANALVGQGPLGGAFNELIGVGANGLAGLIGGSTPQPALSLPSGTPFAKGGVIARGMPVTAFASGGVVSGPTLFPMRSGLGLMGEAGPEAIMPLRRGPSGDLGVGALPANVNVSVTNMNGSKIGTSARQSESGTDVQIMVDNAVSKLINTPGSQTHRSLAARGITDPLKRR